LVIVVDHLRLNVANYVPGTTVLDTIVELKIDVVGIARGAGGVVGSRGASDVASSGTSAVDVKGANVVDGGKANIVNGTNVVDGRGGSYSTNIVLVQGILSFSKATYSRKLFSYFLHQPPFLMFRHRKER